MELLILLLHLFILKDVQAFKVSVVTGKEMVVQAGQELVILCQAGVSLGNCQFEVPGDGSLTLNMNQKPYKNIVYYGEGYNKGQCGLNLRHVQDYHNGLFKCSLTEEGNVPNFSEDINVVVAQKPLVPSLSIKGNREKDSFSENEEMYATCKVENGRPAANISWYIGDEKITTGLSQLNTVDVNNKHLYTVTQNMTRTVLASDNGKALKCVAGHPLLQNGPNTTMQQIRVRFGPKPRTEPIEHFGLVEGEEGKISAVIMANPKPTFYWIIDDEKIHEGDMDSTQRFHLTPATEKVDKGMGYWESVMVVTNLEKEDVMRSYKVVALNKYGEQTYTVKISTNPEPKMLELGVATIFGIVIAILVILTLTAILVFARAKGRWCFAERSGPHLAGESDTESAEHHAHKKPKMTFTAVFKKKNDKVASEPDPDSKDVTVKGEQKNGQEEQGRLNPEIRNIPSDEGVVYAELDLQQNAQGRALLVRPEDEKTEYAEIIHTKENKV
ncbi:fasciclin-3 isoform X2 [Cimex lectularius]|uniref:Ig-like domain-containing protein n=1 Tax=Cimex lectularius TaxID=79782 RepID=A0A8I6S082_CIMLE|nr:fasciclin-3 isoform X2 [Cimex lectularius]